MSTKKSKKKRTRIGLIVILTIFVLLVGIQLFLSLYLDSYVENRLTSLVHEQTKGQYELQMDDLNLSVWGRSFEIDNIRLHPSDTTSTAPKLNLKQFSITGIQFFPYLFNGSINVKDVQLSEPEVSFVQNSPDSLTFLQSTESRSSRKKKNKSRNLKIGELKIDNGAATYWSSDLSKARGTLNNFELKVSDIHIDSTTKSHPSFADFSSIQTSSGKIRFELDNDLYALETNGFDISTVESTAFLDSIKLIPLYPKYEFSRQVGHQMDRIDLDVKEVRLNNFNLDKIKTGELKAEKLIIDQAILEVFHSKLLPRGPRSNNEKTFPQVAFKQLNIPVTIDTIAINKSTISYAEHLPEISKPGKVTFADVNATFSDVTNDSSIINQNHTVLLDVTSEVMDEALLTAHFEFPMHMNGSHSVRGTLESLKTEDLNPILEPVGMVRASSGTLHSLQFLMDLGAENATGWVQLVYSDLKIEVLDAENVNQGGSQRFKTFLANTLKVKNNNIDEPLRRGEVSKERILTKSIFSYWWKSLSTGLKDNIGI